MRASKKNKNGIALKAKDIRQEAYLDYCAHLALGKSKRSWRFRKDPNLHCTYQTMESYMKDAAEFDPIHKLEGEIDGYYRWENAVEESALGINKEANTASLQMKMRNKFGWDKPENKELLDSSVIAEKQDALMEQIKQYQEESSALRKAASNINSEKKS